MRSSRQAFTLVEIMVGLSLCVLIAAYLADSFIFTSRSEQAVNKKMITARALQVLQFRVRRDAKWARSVQVTDPIPGSSRGSGFGIIFKDLEGNTRTWRWDQTTQKLTLPEVDKPNGTKTEYNQCKFRWVDFNTQEQGEEGVRVLFAPLPMDDHDKAETQKEVLWGVAMVGRTELDATSTAHRYALFNEPAFAPAPAP